MKKTFLLIIVLTCLLFSAFTHKDDVISISSFGELFNRTDGEVPTSFQTNTGLMFELRDNEENEICYETEISNFQDFSNGYKISKELEIFVGIDD